MANVTDPEVTFSGLLAASLAENGVEPDVKLIEPGIVEINGALFKLEITGDIEVTRGPLGRFLDLAEQIRSEGLQVPPEIEAVLETLQLPQEG